jgi:hypothetical protein
VTEQNPVAVPQQRRDDASLRRAFRGDRHTRIVPPVVSDTVPCRVPAACPIARRAAATRRLMSLRSTCNSACQAPGERSLQAGGRAPYVHQ